MAQTSVRVFELLKVTDNLKHLKRTGWVKCGIPEPETVAGHMYRMAILAWSLKEELPQVDIDRCVQMSLVHDIGEAIAGDITPHCGVSNADKFALESQALDEISAMVPASIGDAWKNLWMEYEAAETKEALVVKQLDKFDMIAQAFEYEQRYEVDLQQFFDSTTQAFKSEPFLSWDKQLREKRRAFIKEKTA